MGRKQQLEKEIKEGKHSMDQKTEFCEDCVTHGRAQAQVGVEP